MRGRLWEVKHTKGADMFPRLKFLVRLALTLLAVISDFCYEPKCN